MKMENRFTAVFEQVGEWWIGYVEELPGANTQGKTLEETRENLKEAVQLVIEANRELARREAEGKHVIREELLVAV
jgi:predicted RNase H-like HicB family nuclease